MPLTIVMYHYVRDLVRARYPAIKGRDAASFRNQLDYIGRHYTVVSAEQVIAAVKTGEELPGNAAWLTFDDGYIDHFSVVFPLLHERGWQGSFFPPAKTIQDRVLLDVNRVHFILASCPSPKPIVETIQRFIDDRQGEGEVRPFAQYWSELAHASRMDPAEVIFIKRVLQHGLPEAARNELAAALFERYVSVDPMAFAAELYMTPEQVRMMIRCGMFVGSHGAAHYWLDRLNPIEQAREIDASLAFLGELGAPVQDWVMCYPFGAYDSSLISLPRKRGCTVGLTTRVAVAQLGADDPLKLPRLDTNDLPA